jgi:16S rRNA (cytosine967-C5)-methyltransferase
MSAISPARKAAFKILLFVDRSQGHSDDLLRDKNVSALAPNDRNLATTLVLGVLRWQIQLDDRLQSLLAHPNAKLDAEVRIALRLGAFQLLHLDRIPARAAIDESVELTKQFGHRFASGMVNAVLRKLASSRSSASDRGLALTYAHPSWLVERWIESFGAERAGAICMYGQHQPSIAIRMDDSATEPELFEAGISLAPGQLLTLARKIIGGDVTTTEAFQQGRIRLQDEGSQLVAEIAAGALAASPHKILDCCAAPGGKTLILAERNPQAHIVACESSPQRLEQLRERLAHMPDRIECRLADATALTESSVYDLALADVPCSGTGTLGRNPEIRHRLHIEDFARQAERQQAILTSALQAVRDGGRVIYSTCSLEPEENEQVIAAVLRNTPNARVCPLSSRIEQMHAAGVLTDVGLSGLQACLTSEGYLRLLPGVLETDGFFVAMLEKSACTVWFA